VAEKLQVVARTNVSMHIPVAPGTACSAEIKTDKRRVIEFFLSPLIKHVDESLKLRWLSSTPFFASKTLPKGRN